MTAAAGPAHDDSLLPVASARTHDGLVGRAAELRAIGGIVAGLRDGAGISVLVTGEAGIGKTSLLRAAAGLAADQGATVAWGHVWAAVDAPILWPWVQILRAVDGHGLPAVDGQMLRAVDGHGLPADRADVTVRDAIVNRMGAAARRRPLLVLVDDLHLADPVSLRVFEQVATVARETSLGIVGALRDDALDGEHSDVIARLRATSLELTLDGLAPAQCGELARSLLGESLPPVACRTLFERTGGNPFLCEEVLAGRADGPGGLAWPARSMLEDRLDRLEDAERHIIDVASVHGRFVYPELLAHAADLDVAQVAAVVARLERAGLARTRHDGCAAVWPGLLADTARELLHPARRIELHHMWAETLADGWPQAAEQPSMVATHLLAARPAVDRADARRWAMRAAVAAEERHDHDDAARWYEQALDTFGRDEGGSRARRDVLLALGRALLAGTGARRAVAVFEDASAVAERDGDAMGRLDALVWSVEARRRVTGFEHGQPARATLAAALDETTAAPPLLLARTAEQLARIDALFGEPADAGAAARRAVAMAHRSGDSDALVTAQRAQRWAVAASPAHSKRVATRQLVRTLDRRSPPRAWWEAHAWLLVDALEAGDRRVVDAELASCRRLADQVAEPYLSSLTGTWTATVALMEGRYDEAEQLIAQGLEAAERAGLNTGALQGLRLFLAWDRGDAVALANLAPGVAGALPDRSALWGAVLAALHADQGRVDEGSFELDRLAVDDFAHVPRSGQWLTTMALCAMACVRLERADLAGCLRRLVAPFQEQCVVAGDRRWLFLGSVRYYAGMLAVAAGHPEAGLADLDAAIRVHRQLGARPWTARTMLEQGRAYLARGQAGDAERAAEAFTIVQTKAEALGMTSLAGHAAGLAESRPQPRPTLAPQAGGWQVAYSGPPFHLHDSKGLRCLHRLIARPGERIPAAELAGDAVTDPERARVNVTRQLRAAIDGIGEHDAALGGHLRAAVTTGRMCAYRPAGTPPGWRLG